MRRKQIKVGREKWEEKMDKDMESSILIPPPHTFLSTLPASFTWYHIFEFTGGGWSDVDLAWIIHAFSSSRLSLERSGCSDGIRSRLSSRSPPSRPPESRDSHSYVENSRKRGATA